MIRAFLLFLAQIPLILIGFVVVALAIPFTRIESVMQPFSQYPQHGNWWLERLPKWALWWDNPFDGVLGDKRGWWANERGGNPHSWTSKWLWTAVRNPVNCWSRLVAGVDVSRCVIDKKWGDDEVVEEPGAGGAQYLVARRDDGKTFPRLFIVWPWFFRKDRAVLIDIGWKIKLSHNGTAPDARPQDRFKGDVFTISPWKGLE